MYISNMIGHTGEPVKNQFVVIDDNQNEFFKSYQTIIAKRYPLYNRVHHLNLNRSEAELNTIVVELDAKKWDYSVTTSKYRNRFLGETTAQTKAKIKSGEYILTNLNK